MATAHGMSNGKTVEQLPIGELHDGSQVTVTYMTIKGEKPGPTLLLTAGMNGNTLNAIEAARRISRDIDPRNLKGTLRVVPVFNVPAFKARSRYNLFENFPGPTQAVGGFPGSESGLFTHRLAHLYTTELISEADYYLEIGTGASTGCFSPYAIIYPFDHPSAVSVRGKCRELARAFGTKFVLDLTKERVEGRAAQSALRKGIPALLVESGEAGRLDEEYVESHLRGVYGVMTHLEMIDGKESAASQIELVKTTRVPANRGGFFQLKAKLGDYIDSGQVLAVVSNMFYETLEEIRSPVDGYVLRITTTPTVSTGDQVATLGLTE